MSPLYDWSCESCGEVQEAFFPVRLKPTRVRCGHCRGWAYPAYLKAPGITGDISDYARKRFPYYDESLDVRFNSHSEKKAYLAKNNLRVRESNEPIRGLKRTPYDKSDAIIVKGETQKETDSLLNEAIKKRIAEKRRQ